MLENTKITSHNHNQLPYNNTSAEHLASGLDRFLKYQKCLV